MKHHSDRILFSMFFAVSKHLGARQYNQKQGNILYSLLLKIAINTEAAVFAL